MPPWERVCSGRDLWKAEGGPSGSDLDPGAPPVAKAPELVPCLAPYAVQGPVCGFDDPFDDSQGCLGSPAMGSLVLPLVGEAWEALPEEEWHAKNVLDWAGAHWSGCAGALRHGVTVSPTSAAGASVRTLGPWRDVSGSCASGAGFSEG